MRGSRTRITALAAATVLAVSLLTACGDEPDDECEAMPVLPANAVLQDLPGAAATSKPRTTKTSKSTPGKAPAKTAAPTKTTKPKTVDIRIGDTCD